VPSVKTRLQRRYVSAGSKRNGLTASLPSWPTRALSWTRCEPVSTHIMGSVQSQELFAEFRAKEQMFAEVSVQWEGIQKQKSEELAALRSKVCGCGLFNANLKCYRLQITSGCSRAVRVS
jgi:hypothetical protein